MGTPPSFCKLTFYNPLHFSCTIACGCSDPLDDCDVTTGQCPCRPLATGRTCDRCEVNTFGDPNLGCMVSGENCQLCTSLPHGSAERSTMTLAILHVTVHKAASAFFFSLALATPLALWVHATRRLESARMLPAI